MNNILKRLWVAVVIAIGIFIVGYLINGKQSNLEKNNKNVNANSNSSEVLLSSKDKEKLKYKDIESDYKEIERLENILNNQYY